MMGCCVLALLVGIVMRWIGVAYSGWVISLSGALLVFLFLLPAMGGRMREPPDSAYRRAPWGD